VHSGDPVRGKRDKEEDVVWSASCTGRDFIALFHDFDLKKAKRALEPVNVFQRSFPFLIDSGRG
jgi:hypothetical protein